MTDVARGGTIPPRELPASDFLASDARGQKIRKEGISSLAGKLAGADIPPRGAQVAAADLIEGTQQQQIAARIEGKMDQLLRGMTMMQSAILAQQEEIAKLNRALDAVRVSRTQELAIGEAIRARAKAIARAEGLSGSEKKIAGAIRTTVREVTGARATGDIQASQYAKVIELIGSWYMSGAMRRIKREAQHAGQDA